MEDYIQLSVMLEYNYQEMQEPLSNYGHFLYAYVWNPVSVIENNRYIEIIGEVYGNTVLTRTYAPFDYKAPLTFC